MEIYIICSGPYEEALAVVGDAGFSERNLRECWVFAKQIARAFGQPPAKAELIIKSELHDFGVVWNVAVQFDPDDSEAVAYADRVENGQPRWDEVSLKELEP
jgi:hypothetical protein